MEAELGNIPENLGRAERLIEDAFRKGATWVILPEFFPTAMAYHPAMRGAPMPLDGPALHLLVKMAQRYRGHVGGSFISMKDGDQYNTFVLAGPDGRYASHDKTIATWWEHCYYLSSQDEGIARADGVRAGLAICWEFALWRTAKRLTGKVDFVVGGSCWFATPKTSRFKRLIAKSEEYNLALVREAPRRLARVLGVPVVHACQVGPFAGTVPLLPMSYESHYQGESQIVSATGEVLARMRSEDGPGVIVADIDPTPQLPSEPMGTGFWIRLKSTPLPVRLGFVAANCVFKLHGRAYYQLAKLRRAIQRQRFPPL
jgi:predicted amidohydrolase